MLWLCFVGRVDTHICYCAHCNPHMTKHLFVWTIFFFASMCLPPSALLWEFVAQWWPLRNSSHLYFQARFALHCNISGDVSLFTGDQVLISFSVCTVDSWKKKNIINTTLWSLFHYTDNYCEGNWSTFIQKGFEYTIQILFLHPRC